jgi:centromere DNA-binding complex CBF3 subunit-like protein
MSRPRGIGLVSLSDTINCFEGGCGDPKTPLDESTHRKWIRDIFNEIGHKSSQTTHAGRKSGAQCAEITGVSEEEIRRARRWNDLRNHRWTKAQHTQLVKSWLLPFYYLDLFRTVTTAIKLEPELCTRSLTSF